MSSLLDGFLGPLKKVGDTPGVVTELCRGLTVRKNSRNPFTVATLRYEADPDKDPLTEAGREWARAEMRDMGCYRICRECDHVWAITDEQCPECENQTELVLSNQWRREYEIDYAAQAGSYVFDAFSEARNTCDPFRIPSGWRRWRVIDHGLRNPTACLFIAVDPDRNGWVYGEHYEAGRGVDYHCGAIHRLSVKLDGHCMPKVSETTFREMERSDWTPSKFIIEDCQRLYQTLGDPSMGRRTASERDTILHRYNDNGIYIKKAKNAVAGLETLNAMFSLGTLTIFRNCTNTIREVKNLVWQENADPAKNMKEREVDKDNHTVDTLKYWANEFAPASPERANARVDLSSGQGRSEEHQRRFQQRAKQRPDDVLDL